MKKLNRIAALSLLLGVGVMMSCEDPDLSPNLTPEGNANGFGTFLVGGKPQKDPFDLTKGQTQKLGTDFLTVKPGFTSVPATISWSSFDKKVVVNKIELYVKLAENYVDKDGNKVVAKHGGEGKLLTTITPAGMYESNNFTVDASKVYDLLKDSKFDYGDGKGEVSVFTSNPKRTTASPFLGDRDIPFRNRVIAVTGDDIEVTWKLYGENGLVYKSWSPSVCEEFVGANCRIVTRVR
ncbi:hypothetical protein [Persicitalea jodogahamensis]|uniref:Lipoprotein n=1 Tax=Persicitalea jodogahamensis TaxID=402147 RepID=A0A8J3GAV0_9BACT|nr:hypothetical protein [Persicitalea jodogahamensis]GHB72394.1 hypothetical protein GCM10007390_28060 [Persicitalea jodogahamensis]